MNISLFCCLATLVSCAATQGKLKYQLNEHVQAEGSKIGWNLRCAAEKKICLKVKEALHLAARFVENAIILKPIKVLVYFRPFQHIDGTGKIIGTGRPKYLPVQADNLKILYPQALYKQIYKTNNVKFANFDCVINTNATKDFYFPSDYHKKITPTQLSYMDHLIHEMNHGLGFHSKLKGAYEKHIYNTGCHEDVPLSVFDTHTFIKKTNKPFLHYALQSTRTCSTSNEGPPTLDKPQDYEGFDLFHAFSKAIKGNEAFYFKTSQGTRVNLEHSIKDGIKLDHLNKEDYINTKDQIALAKRRKGRGISDMFQRDQEWPTSPYGPETLKVLTTLGYKLNPSPKYENSMQYHYFKFLEAKSNTETPPRGRKKTLGNSRGQGVIKIPSLNPSFPSLGSKGNNHQVESTLKSE
ncbi:hypothetical protein DSO57_1012175 [Entomophthora muscae]|uniref:Uncharacterized protein n=1 Tax=Entomophthora muscae TaxID=34485 RepID=A0ACC2THC2_9FUNG|nr:hypothetical protein DSO57_1012175 [Entomophthora muscae]